MHIQLGVTSGPGSVGPGAMKIRAPSSPRMGPESETTASKMILSLPTLSVSDAGLLII